MNISITVLTHNHSFVKTPKEKKATQQYLEEVCTNVVSHGAMQRGIGADVGRK